jgi:flagellin
MVIANGGTNYTFATQSSGLSANGTTVFKAADNTLNGLETAINGAKGTTGVSAALNSDGTGLAFTATSTGTSISVTSSGLTDISNLSFTNPPNGSTDTSQYQAGVIALADGGNLSALQSSAQLNGTVTVSNGNVTDTFVMGATSSSVSGGTVNVVGNTIGALLSAINTEGSDTTHAGMDLHLTASSDGATGGIYLQSNQVSTTVAADTSNLTATLGETAGTGVNGAGGQSATAAHVVYTNSGTNDSSDAATGSIVLTNTRSGGGAAYGAGATTFSMGGSVKTLGDLAAAITASNLDLSASVSSSGLTITSNDHTSVMVATSTLKDSYGVSTTTQQVAGTSATAATNAAATVGISNNGSVGSSDALSGSLVLTNNGTTHTFVMGSTANVNGSTITTASTSLQALATAISQDTTLGLTGSVANGALDLQANAPNTTITVGGSLSDTVKETATAANTGITGAASTATMTMASALATTDIMTGSVAISANGKNSGNAVTFVMGSSANSGGASGSLSGSTYTVNGNTLADLKAAISDELGVNATVTGTTSNSLTLTSNTDNATAINITSAAGSLKDAGTGATTSTSSLGSFASLSDKVSGTVSFSLAGSNTPVSFSVGGSTTVQGLINQINTGSTTSNGSTDPYGVHATATKNTTTGFYSVTLTSDTYGTAGDIQNTVGTSITDQTGTASLSYSVTSAYNTGLSNTSVYDSSSGQTSSTLASVTANGSGSNGVATISYSDGAGQSLSTTDLSNQTDARTALTALNSAITDVAAQDGYIGAQINTLNAVSQVLSTQQENVESAQNAVQATDYASATSNMSKYEILSQTGIAALAQANSVQQEVTKLLQ